MTVEATVRKMDWTNEHFATLGKAVPMGYTALQALVEGTPMLGKFLPGLKMTGYLRNLAVQYALDVQAAATGLFYTDTGFNAPKNHAFLKVTAHGILVTAHYAGPKGTRGLPKAIVRGELVKRNGDLFGSENGQADAHEGVGIAYVQLRHGGLTNPVFAGLFIPNRDQRTYKMQPMILDMATPSKAEVEEVKDQLSDAMTRKARTTEPKKNAG